MKADQILFLLRHFDEFDPKINVLSGLDKRKKKRAICPQYAWTAQRPLLTTEA